MSNKPETGLVKKIMEMLRAQGGFWFKVYGSPFQMVGIPDILGCYKGLFVAIEVKMPNNTPSTSQLYVISEIKKAGGRAGVAYSLQQALDIRDNVNQ